MTKKEKERLEQEAAAQAMLELKIDFNDVVMRELGLDYDEETGHIYNIDTEEMFTIKNKFIKYSEDMYPVLSHNEMDLNLIENPRLMEFLFGIWIKRRAESKGIEITSYYQSSVRDTKHGFFVVTYLVMDEPREQKSDVFINESVRIFNLICKLNHRTNLYKNSINRFDIEIVRKE